MLEQAQDLIAHAVPQKKWSESLTYLAQKEIDRRAKTQRTRVTPKDDKTDAGAERSPRPELSEPVVAEKKASEKTSVVYPAQRESLRSSLRKAILVSSSGCFYQDPATGKTCGSCRFLQIDHRQSIWAGGKNELANLQVLCAQHNRLKYRKEAGLHPLRR